MALRQGWRLGWCALAVCALAACASQDDTADATDSVDSADSVDEDRVALAAARLTPSNLPSNICDRPGTKNLKVPAGGDAITIDSDATCDALVPQANGLPTICVRKFASVSIDGVVNVKGDRALALVATRTMSLHGFVHGQNGANAPQPGGEPPAPPSQGNGLGGGGHVTAGGAGGGPSAGGAAFGPTTGAALVPGSGPEGGRGGGAVQLVSCGALDFSGQVSVEGINGGAGDSRPQFFRGGAGGRSAGTIVIEAVRITGTGGKLIATGGNGGCADIMGGPCACGLGGTGAHPPTDGTVPPGSFTGGGGGGAAGRNVVNVPQGVSVPAIAADPPASIGVVGTH